MSRYDPTSDPIVQQLAGLSKTSFNRQFIFRVHQRLRSQNEEAYKPEMISIGPYHRGKDKLQKMEKYKLQYLQGILERQGTEFIPEFRAAVIYEEAHNCYAEDISLSPEEFVDMMILDGCFIIEFLRKYNVFKGKVEDPHIYEKVRDDPIFSMQWQVESLCRDLLLFENQLPFFILERLFNLTNFQSDQGDLSFYAISCLNHCIAADNPDESSYNIKPPENRVFHLPRLMYESWCSSRDTQEEEGEHQNSSSTTEDNDQNSSSATENNENEDEDVKELTLTDTESQTPIYMPWKASLATPAEDEDLTVTDTDSQTPTSTFFPVAMVVEMEEATTMDPTFTVEEKDLELLKSVCELEEHGIEFEKAKESKSWLDIKFENSVMRIPTLKVQDHTESLLRNLIAYEEYMFELGYSRKVVTDYAYFMMCLLKSSEDAKKLRHHKIIKNMLGKDEAVSEMFNKICNNIFYYPASYSYSDIFKKVNEHCSKRRNRWMADLKKTYFKNPWSIIAFLAAAFLLLLSVIETILAFQETKEVCNCK